MYLEGCRLLCEEANPRRRDTGLVGTYDAEQLLAVATRIAAVTMFTNRFGIWTGLDIGDVPEDAVAIRKLKGGFENDGEYKFHVNADLIKDTLNTGLFSSQGQNRAGWAHQTYFEFLAARYLVQSQMELEQIMDLLSSHEDPRRLVPQLHGVAAEIANMRHDILQVHCKGRSRDITSM